MPNNKVAGYCSLAKVQTLYFHWRCQSIGEGLHHHCIYLQCQRATKCNYNFFPCSNNVVKLSFHIVHYVSCESSPRTCHALCHQVSSARIFIYSDFRVVKVCYCQNFISRLVFVEKDPKFESPLRQSWCRHSDW